MTARTPLQPMVKDGSLVCDERGSAAYKRLAMTTEWQPFTGDYDKRFYSIRLHRGGQVVHVYPNAGVFNSVDGTGKLWHGSEVAEFKPCTCGHKLGGCLP